MYKQLEINDQTEVIVHEVPADLPVSRPASVAWARIIKRNIEVDLLLCLHCRETMRVMALIEDPPVIEKILTYLRLYNPRPARPRQRETSAGLIIDTIPLGAMLGRLKSAQRVRDRVSANQTHLSYAPLPDIAKVSGSHCLKIKGYRRGDTLPHV